MSLAVDRYELGPVGTNCYVVRREPSASEAVVVDPGADSQELPNECAGILITHSHWDHLGGVAALAERTGAKVYMPREEAPVLANPADWFPEVPLRPYMSAAGTLVASSRVERTIARQRLSEPPPQYARE